MTAVAVWESVPSEEALLEARWQDGWRPMPSPMREGPKVLGYAACRVKG